MTIDERFSKLVDLISKSDLSSNERKELIMFISKIYTLYENCANMLSRGNLYDK